MPRKVRQQCFCCIVGGTLVWKFGFEMTIHDDCASTNWRDIGALYISNEAPPQTDELYRLARLV